MIKFPDTLESTNPQEYGIVKADQIIGHKTVQTLDDLYNIPDVILSKSRTNEGDDAIGQEWYVVSEKKKYILADWAKRKTAEGWATEQGSSGAVNSVNGKTGTVTLTSNDIPIYLDTEEQETLGNLSTFVSYTLSDKQDKLVSGNNIKTINKQSLLGYGDIKIEGVGIKDDNTIFLPGANIEKEDEPIAKGEVFNLIKDIPDGFYTRKANKATGAFSHAEGLETKASDMCSHAEGWKTNASGMTSHAEGGYSESNGGYSHAEGFYSKSSGDYSHSQNFFTTAGNFAQTSLGQYNTIEETPSPRKYSADKIIFSIGNGIGESDDRSDALKMLGNGTTWISGIGGFTGKNSNPENSLQHTINNKQDNLISGETIKTVNGESILGRGNISIQSGGGGASVNVVDNLDSSSTTSALSANQGKILNTKKADVSELTNYVKKELGKGLSANDFTNVLKAKLETLKNYDDAELTRQITSLQGQLDTLVSGSASEAIESFNEIVKFLDGITDKQSLSAIVAGINQAISNVDKKIPTKVSQLQNDSNFLTKHQSLDGYAKTVDVDNKLKTKAEKTEIPTALAQLKDDAQHRFVSDEEKAKWNKGGAPYQLPIANANTLGGVKPVAKTTEMGEAVGVDEAGRLWTKQGTGGGSGKPSGGYQKDLYEALGAKWNGTHYELNGLTDITEEQMSMIYLTSATYSHQANLDIHNAFEKATIRTNFYSTKVARPIYSARRINADGAFGSSEMEVVKVYEDNNPSNNNAGIYLNSAAAMFQNCKKLKKIIGRIILDKSCTNCGGMILFCSLLESVEIKGLMTDLKLNGTPNLDKPSILYMINNRGGDNTISIRMEKSMYNKYIGDGDVTKAAQAHNVTLVSL